MKKYARTFRAALVVFVIACFTVLPMADALAKGFGGGGGSRGGGGFGGGGGFKSSPSPSSSYRPSAPSVSTPSPSKPPAPASSTGSASGFSKSDAPKAPAAGYDPQGAKAKAVESSTKNYDNYKASQAPPSEKRVFGSSTARSDSSSPRFDSKLSETRQQRENRVTTSTTIVRNSYYTPAPIGVYYGDPFSNWFIQYATMDWMFHHWDRIDHNRFEAAKLRELEAEIVRMKAAGKVQDPGYKQPGIDEDLVYNKEKAYDDGHGFFWWFMVIVGILSVVIIGVYFVFIRKYDFS